MGWASVAHLKQVGQVLTVQRQSQIKWVKFLLSTLLPLFSVSSLSHSLLLFSAAQKLPFPMLLTCLSFLPILSQVFTDLWHIYWALHTRPGPGERKVLRAFEAHSGSTVQWADIGVLSQRCLHCQRGWYLSPKNKSGAGNFRFQSRPAKEIVEEGQLLSARWSILHWEPLIPLLMSRWPADTDFQCTRRNVKLLDLK